MPEKESAAINQRIAANTTIIATINQRIAAINQRIAAIDQRIATINQRIAAIDQRIAANRKDITSIRPASTEVLDPLFFTAGSVAENPPINQFYYVCVGFVVVAAVVGLLVHWGMRGVLENLISYLIECGVPIVSAAFATRRLRCAPQTGLMRVVLYAVLVLSLCVLLHSAWTASFSKSG